MTYVTTGLVDRSVTDYSVESAICKVYGSETLWRTVNETLQIAAGIGYMQDYPYERLLRDARINMIFEGTNEILRALIALSGLQQPGEHLKEIGKAFRDPLHSLGAIGSFLAGRVKRQVVTPVFANAHPALKEEGEMIGTVVHDLALAVEKQLIAHGKEVIEHQFQQERMANVAIDVYVATATLSRATWAIARAGGAEKAEADLDNARIFIPMAMRRARRNVRAMERNQDARLKSLAQRALESGSLTVAAPTDA
jgi:acyl-CoA dehydrogenase family protein 9